MKATTPPTLRERWNDLSKQWSDNKLDSHEVVERYCEYIHFTAQKLALWMFVPCNSKGEPMEKPELNKVIQQVGDKLAPSRYADLDREYQKALDACIFEGCILKNMTGYDWLITKGGLTIAMLDHEDEKGWDWKKRYTIEDLITANIPLTLKPRYAKELNL